MKKAEADLFSVWNGVFQSFEEAGGDSDAFDTERWIQTQQLLVREQLRRLSTHQLMAQDYPLSVMVGMLLPQHKTLSILDFGGGMGQLYLTLLSALPEAVEKIRYHVVDGKASIDNRPHDLNQFSHLFFYDNTNEIDESKIEVIHIGSTLQYIENWQDLLNFLNKRFKPNYYVFSDTMVGEVPNFVSHQQYYDKKIPVQFLNEQLFMQFMLQHLKLRLLYKTKYQGTILGQNDIFPNQALPNQYQIDRTYHFIFSASEEANQCE